MSGASVLDSGERPAGQVFLEQLYSIGAVNRDPRELVVTVAYYALVKLSDHRIKAATDARDAAWFAVSEASGLAFDRACVPAPVAALPGRGHQYGYAGV